MWTSKFVELLKFSRIFLWLTFLLFFFQNCGQALESVDVSSTVVDLESGERLFSTKCSACHTVDELYGKTETDINDAIATIRNMRSLSTLTDLQRSAIATYLQFSTPVPDTVENPIRPLIGDRNYMSNFMTNIFVAGAPSAADTTTVENIISRNVNAQVGVFGGPCYLEESNCPGDIGNVDENTGAESSPAGSSLRSGYTVRTCTEILQAGNVATESVLNIAGVTESATANRSNMLKIFNVFFPGRIPTDLVLDRLIDVVQVGRSGGLTNIESWKYPMHVMCVSPLFGKL